MPQRDNQCEKGKGELKKRFTKTKYYSLGYEVWGRGTLRDKKAT